MSVRDPAQPEQFAITASQTGALAVLVPTDLVRVLRCNLGRFWVDAEGFQPPSSETLTHGMIYAADPEIHWVFHCHSPEVWRRAPALDLPCTPAGVSYGSPAMTAAVAQVLRRHKHRPMLFATLGHEDGLFACGATAEAAGTRLVAALAQARS
jgi:ribulose-5-phosphate 4-epimerase/fuculose-1-phosphate aldolase